VGKRMFDITVGTVLLVILAPIIALCALGVAISLRARPFFVQERIGYRGAPFRLIKLRTLPSTAPRFADKYAISEIDLPWFPRLLRRLHLDELPQLLMVVTGTMSLVGPRPEMACLNDKLPADIRADRARFRPGCTGLWQVSRDADKLIAEAPEYDTFYGRHAGMRLDAFILVRTVLMSVAPNLRVTLDDVPIWCLPEAPRAALGTATTAGLNSSTAAPSTAKAA
jgi:lipopolysaccharide/colanic/teichoic acid biosynthesis glycosyltransferase